jgi:hypothetical protein
VNKAKTAKKQITDYFHWDHLYNDKTNSLPPNPVVFVKTRKNLQFYLFIFFCVGGGE